MRRVFRHIAFPSAGAANPRVIFLEQETGRSPSEYRFDPAFTGKERNTSSFREGLCAMAVSWYTTNS